MDVSWFFLALAAPLLWALGNFIDKGLISRLAPSFAPVGTLLLYSSLFSVLILPGTYFLSRIEPFSLPMSSIAMLVAAGIAEMCAIALYLHALAREETSVVVPLLQTIPIFSFIFGFLLLGETLTTFQVVACGIVIAGCITLTIDFSNWKRPTFRLAIFSLSVISAAMFALFDALFKLGGASFWPSVFWQHVGKLLFGIALFLSADRYRSAFVQSLRTSGKVVFGFNMLNEGMYAAGVMCLTAALLRAPIALVSTVAAYQPVFVLLLGTLLTAFVPQLVSEKISGWHLIHKVAAIAVITMGSAFLLFK